MRSRAHCPSRDLIFARQKLRLLADLRGLDPKDRITPIVAALFERPRPLRRSVGRTSRFRRSASHWPAWRAASATRCDRRCARPAADAAGRRRGCRACTCASSPATTRCSRSGRPRDGSPWPLGIPRLRTLPMHRRRSALKLEEAFLTLLERRRTRAPGRSTACAPPISAPRPAAGRWVLTRHGLRVIAIDNGPLRQNVLDTGLRRTPARRRLPVATAEAAGLDGLRHGRAAAPRRRAHGDTGSAKAGAGTRSST